jgi:hypothetical protein
METMKSLKSVSWAVPLCLLLVSLLPSSARASAAPLRLSDVVKQPVDISISGDYYSGQQKSFALDVSADRFIKVYSDGATIIGLKGKEAPSYYVIDHKNKTVLKISQGNLYRTGQFFNWSTMTTLIDLPGATEVSPLAGKADDCTGYSIANSDTELCIDGNRRILRKLWQKGKVVAQVTAIKQLSKDLKEQSEALILNCRRQHYRFIDVDSDLAPDAD